MTPSQTSTRLFASGIAVSFLGATAAQADVWDNTSGLGFHNYSQVIYPLGFPNDGGVRLVDDFTLQGDGLIDRATFYLTAPADVNPMDKTIFFGIFLQDQISGLPTFMNWGVLGQGNLVLTDMQSTPSPYPFIAPNGQSYAANYYALSANFSEIIQLTPGQTYFFGAAMDLGSDYGLLPGGATPGAVHLQAPHNGTHGAYAFNTTTNQWQFMVSAPETAFTLSYAPAPSGAALLLAAGMLANRRRR